MERGPRAGRKVGQAAQEEGGYAFSLGESHWLGPTSSGPVPLSQWLWAAREGAAGGGPRAEQPGGSGMPGIQVTRRCEINGSSEEPRTAWRSLPRERKRLQAGLPHLTPPLPAPRNLPSDFLSVAASRPQSLPSPTGHPHSASCQLPIPPDSQGLHQGLLPPCPSPPPSPASQGPKVIAALLSSAWPSLPPAPAPPPIPSGSCSPACCPGQPSPGL